MTRLDLYIDLDNNRWGELNGEPIDLEYKDNGYRYLAKVIPKTDVFKVWLVVDGKHYDTSYSTFVFGFKPRAESDVYQEPIEFMSLADFGLKNGL